MYKVKKESLAFKCDETLLPFSLTSEIDELENTIGQKRAVGAIDFGLFNRNSGYNIFVAGLVGTGKLTYTKKATKKIAEKQAVPNDWCYVNNFENHSQPIAVSLVAGMGYQFKQDMQNLVELLKAEIPKAFSSDDYEQAKMAIIKKIQEWRNTLVEKFNVEAEEIGIMPQWTQTGFVGAPIVEGKTLTPEEYQTLSREEKEVIEKRLLTVHDMAVEVVRQMQLAERKTREELKELDGKVALFAVGHMIEELKEKYKAYEKVVFYLEAVCDDIVKNIDEFKPRLPEEEHNPFNLFKKKNLEGVKDRYKVNLLIDNKEAKGAPVIYEINPTYYNLVGRLEYETRMSVVNTDFTMIKPGALHKANGGYLILNVKDVLLNLGAWDALKRALKTKTLRIENLNEQYGLFAMATIKPEPIALNLKVILVGTAELYHLLYIYDEDFRKFFKIHADFDTEMENNEENIKQMAGFVSATVKKNKLKHFHRNAVAKIIEYAVKLAGSQDKIATRFNKINAVICEADAWASMAGDFTVQGKHVQKAIKEWCYRENRYEEKMHELFANGTLLLDTDGEKVGQVNGLAVLSTGAYAFGKPSRITANTFIGRTGIINIERETQMSGKSHTKGVLILAGYIGEKYAQKRPLTLSASLTFEQLYGGIDGDSASSAELYALLSSLAEIPIKQYIAVTGSVNQKGEIQPIGGVTEKIEGFFAICKQKGLTGKQGVLIPKQNIKNLALSDEVIEAIEQGVFHVYAVGTVDEGINVLTGIDAGVVQSDGVYKKGTIHYLVNKKLSVYEKQLHLNRPNSTKKKKKKKKKERKKEVFGVEYERK